MITIQWSQSTQKTLFKLACATGTAQLCGVVTSLFALTSQDAYDLAYNYQVSKINGSMSYMDTIVFDLSVRISSLTLFSLPGVLIGFPVGWVLAKSVLR